MERSYTSVIVNTILLLTCLCVVSIVQGQNVGIETDDPDEKLHVHGNIKSDSALIARLLEMRDAEGENRIRISADSGTLEFWDNDTLWYRLSVSSPPEELLRTGDYTVYHFADDSGNLIVEYRDENNVTVAREVKEFVGEPYAVKGQVYSDNCLVEERILGGEPGKLKLTSIVYECPSGDTCYVETESVRFEENPFFGMAVHETTIRHVKELTDYYYGDLIGRDADSTMSVEAIRRLVYAAIPISSMTDRLAEDKVEVEMKLENGEGGRLLLNPDGLNLEQWLFTDTTRLRVIDAGVEFKPPSGPSLGISSQDSTLVIQAGLGPDEIHVLATPSSGSLRLKTGSTSPVDVIVEGQLSTYELRLPLVNSGTLVLDDNGITLIDSLLFPVIQINPDGTSMQDGMSTLAGGLRVDIGNGGAHMLVDSQGLRIYDDNDYLVTHFRPDGTSVHAGLETYEQGLEVHTPFDGRVLIDENGVAILDSNDIPKTHLNYDGQSWHFGRERFYDGISVYHDESETEGTVIDSNGLRLYNDAGELVTEFKHDGTSLHTGLETFEGGILIPTFTGGEIHISSSGIFIEDEHGEVVTAFAYQGDSYHGGAETFGGKVEIELGESGALLEIDSMGLRIRNDDNEIVTEFKPDGTSLHKGLETFEGGIEFPTVGGGKIEINEDGIFVKGPSGELLSWTDNEGFVTHERNVNFYGGMASYFDSNGDGGMVVDADGLSIYGAGGLVTRFNPDGTSWHSGLETYAGGIEIPTPGGGVVRIDPTSGMQIIDNGGTVVSSWAPDGTATHAGNETFSGQITVPLVTFGNLELTPSNGMQILSPSGGVLLEATPDGELNAQVKNFRIDHPLDPENKYLYHASIESSERMNMYSGNIVTDTMGFATVHLPDYFEALNTDFRYQLTVIGTFAQAIIKKEISDRTFVIQTDIPQTKVSWLVSGIRHDKYAQDHPMQVEVVK